MYTGQSKPLGRCKEIDERAPTGHHRRADVIKALVGDLGASNCHVLTEVAVPLGSPDQHTLQSSL